MSTFGVKTMAVNMLSEWKRAREEDERTQISARLSSKQWCKPPDGWIKINVEATCQQNTAYIGVGCVVRDDVGGFLRARACRIRSRAYAREAEALSLKEALSWIKEWRTFKCIFEMDAKLLMDALHSTKPGKSFFDMLVDDCKELIKHFEEVLFVFVHRSANNVAHMLAQAAYSTSDPHEWYYTATDFIVCNLPLEGV